MNINSAEQQCKCNADHQQEILNPFHTDELCGFCSIDQSKMTIGQPCRGFHLSVITWLISERTHKIRPELVVLRFVEDSHFFHEGEQGDYLTSNKRIFDHFSLVF